MGREIRRTPVGWEHPLNRNPHPAWGPDGWDWTGQGRHFKPLLDQTWGDAYTEWLNGKRAWESGEDPDRAKYPEYSYEDWHGRMPDPLDHRPAWPEGIELGYQLYETVTEGTPLSPSFATARELAAFLVESLHMFIDHDAALRFVDAGWAPSFINRGRGVEPGYEVVAERQGGAS